MKNQSGKKEGFDYLAELLLWVLGGAMFIYLGFRTLHFLGFTFAEEDQIYSYLGLFSTTVGAVIFAVSFKRSKYFDNRPASKGGQVWREDAFKKMVSMVMMVICALGELGLAFADMSLVTAQRGGTVTMTEGELVTYMWLTAGLAAAVGAAVFAIKLHDANPKTDPLVDMSIQDANNDGVLDRYQTNLVIPEPKSNVRQQYSLTDEQLEILSLHENNNHKAVADPTQRPSRQ
jgi:hypothetical protein